MVIWRVFVLATNVDILESLTLWSLVLARPHLELLVDVLEGLLLWFG